MVLNSSRYFGIEIMSKYNSLMQWKISRALCWNKDQMSIQKPLLRQITTHVENRSLFLIIRVTNNLVLRFERFSAFGGNDRSFLVVQLDVLQERCANELIEPLAKTNGTKKGSTLARNSKES